MPINVSQGSLCMTTREHFISIDGTAKRCATDRRRKINYIPNMYHVQYRYCVRFGPSWQQVCVVYVLTYYIFTPARHCKPGTALRREPMLWDARDDSRCSWTICVMLGLFYITSTFTLSLRVDLSAICNKFPKLSPIHFVRENSKIDGIWHGSAHWSVLLPSLIRGYRSCSCIHILSPYIAGRVLQRFPGFCLSDTMLEAA